VPSVVPPEESVEEAAAAGWRRLIATASARRSFLCTWRRGPRRCDDSPRWLRAACSLSPPGPVGGKRPALLEDDVLRRGFRGLKLYPSIQRFHVYDERAYPTYERAEALGVPIVFHFRRHSRLPIGSAFLQPPGPARSGPRLSDLPLMWPTPERVFSGDAVSGHTTALTSTWTPPARERGCNTSRGRSIFRKC